LADAGQSVDADADPKIFTNKHASAGA
jgi:hypothetical protein